MKAVVPILLVISGIIIIKFVGCSGDSGDCKPITQAEATHIDPEKTGIIKGMVLFKGNAPRKVLQMGHAECRSLHGGEVQDESLVVSDGRLQNVFVYIKGGLENFKFATNLSAAQIGQKKCIYVPHVTGVMVCQPVLFTTSDSVDHNVKITADDGSELNNFTLIPSVGKKEFKFTKQCVMAKLTCNYHNWMTAYVGVLNHPYFAVTGTDGSFEFKNVPQGKYIIEVWHETLGTKQSKLVELKPKEAQAVEFTYN